MPYQIPLFPLHTVLFPNASLSLHIFEERYRLMIRRCLHANKRFGVVLIAEGREVGDIAVPHRVGTVARIIRSASREDGTFDVATQGGTRFRLLDSWEVDGYLKGKIEPFDDSPHEPESLQLLAIKVHAMFDRYVTMLGKPEAVQELLRGMPNDAERLSFMVAAAMPISPDQKQSLLELDSTGERMQRLYRILRQQILIRDVVQRAEKRTPPREINREVWGVFSPN